MVVLTRLILRQLQIVLLSRSVPPPPPHPPPPPPPPPFSGGPLFSPPQKKGSEKHRGGGVGGGGGGGGQCLFSSVHVRVSGSVQNSPALELRCKPRQRRKFHPLVRHQHKAGKRGK